MMALPMLVQFSLNREALFTAACAAMLAVWWAFLFWGVWAGSCVLLAVLS